MRTGSLSNFKIPLGFDLRKVVKLGIKNQILQRNCLFSKSRKTLIPKSDLGFGNLRKYFQFASVNGNNLNSCIVGYKWNRYFSRTMVNSGSVAASGNLIINNLISSCGNASDSVKAIDQFVVRSFRKPSKIHGLNGCFIFGINHNHINPISGQLRRRYNTSSSTCYSNCGVSDGILKESSHHETNTSLAIEVDGKHECGLKLLSGSFYLPHPDKESTGGEDAHFICEEKQVIGVADGVGGWSDVGVNAGLYSRSLMSNSVKAIHGEPKHGIDPARVLAKAHLATRAKGSSTACIIALKDDGLHAINLGDSGFVVFRDGCTIFHSPIQQHDFNFTYQLADGSEGDQPSNGQVFKIPVAAGDVIVAGTDGLFDNLYNNEVTALVVQGVRSRVGPEVLAKKIAELARKKALDRKRQSPFSTAAQEAGFRYHGGKLDDVTVVVSFVIGPNNE